MASEFPKSPMLVKGALVGFRNTFLVPIPNIIAFQYNPKELTRNVNPASGEGEGNEEGEETTRIAYPPRESISLTIKLDAADQLEIGNPIAVTMGILPTLSALELLLYPESSEILDLGIPDPFSSGESVQPMEIPLVLFVWGVSRVLPVKVTGLAITEEEFDPMLNPIRASVKVDMQVLGWDDLQNDEFANGAYMWTQMQKEIMASLNLVNSAQNIITGLF